MSRTKSTDDGADTSTDSNADTVETVAGSDVSGGASASGVAGADLASSEAAPATAKEKRAAAAAEKEASDTAAAAEAGDPVIVDPGAGPADPYPGEPTVKVDPETMALVATVPDPTAPAPPPAFASAAFDAFKERVRADEQYAMALLWRFEQLAILMGWPELGHMAPIDPAPKPN